MKSMLVPLVQVLSSAGQNVGEVLGCWKLLIRVKPQVNMVHKIEKWHGDHLLLDRESGYGLLIKSLLGSYEAGLDCDGGPIREGYPG